MQPRIYTYKITFEEIPHWYWGVHKEKKFGESYLGTPTTHKWMWKFYTPKIQILEFFPFTNEGWEEAQKVEDRIILLDLNNPRCLNEACGNIKSLEVLRKNGRIQGKKCHELKDEDGKSIRGKELAQLAHQEKTPEGKSKTAVKAGKAVPPGKQSVKGKKVHKEKDEDGKSLHWKNTVGNQHEEKDEHGRSLKAMRSLQQLWVCLVTGKILQPGPLTHYQRNRGIDTTLRERVKPEKEEQGNE